MEKINIAELLKDCPSGMELDCTMYDGVFLLNVDDDDEDITFPINVGREGGYNISLTKYGQCTNRDFAKCVIFPKGKTTWEGFVPPCKFKVGDIVVSEIDSGIQVFILQTPKSNDKGYCYIGYDFKFNAYIAAGDRVFDRLATEEEKEKLFQAIKNYGYKWNVETKTLEKLIKHTFKVGNTIRGKYTGNVYTISHITPTGYKLTDGTSFEFDAEDAFELVHDKFDITTLVPFESKVLVRDWDSYKWLPAVWGFCDNDSKKNYPYYVVGGQCYEYCIPYKGNEHLIGKKDDCDEFYKIWK